MGATQTWMLRSSVVLGMCAAVVTILYFTPMPEHHFKSCDRPCHELDWPMICRIKLTIEDYYTMNSFCENCPHNLTHCSNKNCVVSDGTKHQICTANRQLPGPTIQVCQNDILLVDITNKVPGQDFTFHWRGQRQHGTQVMDGVPMITQCPITSYMTFQYKFRASIAGTHYWHTYSNSESTKGVLGALIVRQPDVKEPHKRLYDTDQKEHIIITSKRGDNILVNGKGEVIVQKFYVIKGLRHRFRVINPMGCPIEVSIDNHAVKVIALDGHPVNPYEATSMILGKGERLDFVLRANQPLGFYPLTIKSCGSTITSMIYYTGEALEVPVDSSDSPRVFRTDVCESGLGRVCLGDVQSLTVMPPALRGDKVDTRLYLVFDHLINDLGSNLGYSQKSRMNNITFTFPSSPILTQRDDVSTRSLCKHPETRQLCQQEDICECVHVKQVSLGSTVEILLIDNGGDEENVFHLHGYSFYVVGSRIFAEATSIDAVKELDAKGELFKRNLLSPVQKDTIRIPKFGVVAIRFIADNPGFWMLRDELSSHWTRGMDMVLQVGRRRDFHTPPSNFPKCGNWIGPEFFLA